ncbi:MAG: 50S ribosome-binding GTPase [Planctomycetota bacterium]|nr:50S ribosome-binding GTPase [Planctomycetota bacterium]
MAVPAESAFAVLTPPGRGGIAVIRCVGPVAEAALAKCFRPAHSSPDRKVGGMPQPGQLAYGHVVDAEGRPLDEVILYNAGAGAVRKSPAASAAGSNSAGLIFEINCHGGPAAVRAVCDRLAAAGLREVDADRLMELEGLPRITRDARRALRCAFTPLAARILLDQLSGALGRAITEILAALAAGGGEVYLAHGEHTGGRTFAGAPPAPPPVYSRGAKYGAGANVLAAIDDLLQRWRTCGRFLADPPRIVIAGRANAGKSTLLNRLVGAERAITSAAPGTTRDYIEAEAALDGVPVMLIDTAGLRDPGGEIERQGIEQARAELARAAVVIYLVDAGEGVNPEDEATLQSLGDRALAVLSKIDAAGAKAVRAPSVSSGSRHRAGESVAMHEGNPDLTVGARPQALSALTGEGVPALVAAVLEKLGWQAPRPGDAAPFTAEQAAALAAAREDFAAGRMDATAQRLMSLLE